MAKKKSKSKLKSSKVKIKIPTPEPVDEAVVSQVSAFGGVKSPSPLPPPVLPISSHHVMESILKVLQEPAETMYKGLSQRAQHELSPQEVRELRELFSIFDIGGKGVLSYPVLRKSLKTMGFSAEDKELMGAIADCNCDTATGISFPQFVDIVLMEQGDSFDVYEELMSGFSAMDIDRTGKITSQSLKKLCKRLDEDISQAEIDDMVAAADKGGSGEVSHKEFIAIMLKTNLFRGTSVNMGSSGESRKSSHKRNSLFT